MLETTDRNWGEERQHELLFDFLNAKGENELFCTFIEWYRYTLGLSSVMPESDLVSLLEIIYEFHQHDPNTCVEHWDFMTRKFPYLTEIFLQKRETAAYRFKKRIEEEHQKRTEGSGFLHLEE